MWKMQLLLSTSVSANQECVHIEPKCVQYGHILVQGAQKTR